VFFIKEHAVKLVVGTVSAIVGFAVGRASGKRSKEKNNK